MQHWCASVNLLRVFCFGKGQVEHGQVLDAVGQVPSMFADLCREFAQHAQFLVALGQVEFADGVVEFDHRQRLDEQGCTGGRLVVDHRLDAPFELRTQGDDVAPIPLGDDGFLQHGRGRAVGDVLLQLGHQTVVRDFLLAADRGQLGRGGIEHIAAVGEHT